MNIPSVPEIEGYSDLVDLLANMPKLQERLKTLKEMEDMVNSRIGDYDKYTELKNNESQILANLRESEATKADAIANAERIRATALQEADNMRAHYNSRLADVLAKEKTLVAAQDNLQKTLNVLAEKEKLLLSREANAKAAIDAAAQASEKATELKQLFEKKMGQLRNIGNS